MAVILDSGILYASYDRGDDWHGPVGGDRHDAVDRVPPAELGDRIDVAEVDDLRLLGRREPRCVGVPVDGDDAGAELARALDRAPLVASRADEEDRARHRARC